MEPVVLPSWLQARLLRWYALVRSTVVARHSEGTDEHIDTLAQQYLGRERYPFRGGTRVFATLKIAAPIVIVDNGRGAV